MPKNTTSMRRREYLAGITGTATITVAGCLGSEDPPEATDPDLTESTVGLAPDEVVQNDVEIPEYDVEEFEQSSADSAIVWRAPVDVVYAWYHNRAARIVDARTLEQYEELRVSGAAFSPAPDGRSDDPLAGVNKDDRIVTYCTCPHHLAASRAAALADDGYEGVFIVDQGFPAWVENGYDVQGATATNLSANPSFEEDYSNLDNPPE